MDWDDVRRVVRADRWRVELAAAIKAAGRSIRSVAEDVLDADKFRLQMRLGEKGSPFLADLGPLVRVCGLVPVLGPFAEDHGHQLVPLKGAVASSRDVLGAAGAVIHEVGQVASTTARALTGGITPSEAAELKREIHEAQLALVALKVAVDAATLDPRVRAVR